MTRRISTMMVGVVPVRERLTPYLSPGWRTSHLVPADSISTGDLHHLAEPVTAICGADLQPADCRILEGPIPFLCVGCQCRIDFSCLCVRPDAELSNKDGARMGGALEVATSARIGDTCRIEVLGLSGEIIVYLGAGKELILAFTPVALRALLAKAAEGYLVATRSEYLPELRRNEASA